MIVASEKEVAIDFSEWACNMLGDPLIHHMHDLRSIRQRELETPRAFYLAFQTVMLYHGETAFARSATTSRLHVALQTKMQPI